MRRLVRVLARVGAAESEPELHVVGRGLLIGASLLGAAVCVVFAVLGVTAGPAQSGPTQAGAAINAAFAAILLANVAAVAVHRRFMVFLVVAQVTALWFPLMLVVTPVGFRFNMVPLPWTVLPALTAAAFQGRRATLFWLGLTALAVVGAVSIMPIPSDASVMVPLWADKASVIVNTIALAGFTVLGMLYLVETRAELLTALAEEHGRSEALLHNVLPPAIAARLKRAPGTIADRFDAATILFADIVGFTQLSARMTPEDLVALLNDLFSEFDRLVEKHGLEKIKTIGDAYMVVGGLPNPRQDHGPAVASLALDMLHSLEEHRRTRGHELAVRIGLNSGPVVAGVIGVRKFAYDLWGDAVNLASRMESHGVPGTIHVGPGAVDHLRDRFVLESRGSIPIKGKGDMATWFLVGRR